MLLKKELIRVGLEGETNEEVLRSLASVFVEAGVAKESYPDAIVLREQNYPTALPATAFDIAVPHTFAEHVNEPAMGCAVLAHPVEFRQMGSPDITLHPQVLFMLAITDSQDQISTLKKIMGLIQDPETLKKVRDAKSVDEVYDLLHEVLA
ncbi:MAG: PTS sugar transporter subunit IIA [Solobacterium sp.]|nr:PTS sugar transporter subunit IIA [Solobacterium sp.]